MAAPNTRAEVLQIQALFPHFESALIEDVLRANNWNVESSIYFFLPESNYGTIPVDAAAVRCFLLSPQPHPGFSPDRSTFVSLMHLSVNLSDRWPDLGDLLCSKSLIVL
jgi:hypothetical protein